MFISNLKTSDGSIKRYRRVLYRGGATVETGAAVPILNNSSQRIQVYANDGLLGSITGDDDQDITQVYATRVRPGGRTYLRVIEINFSQAGWDKFYDASTANKLKAPYTNLKYNGGDLAYNSGNSISNLNASLQYILIPGRRTLYISFGLYGGWNFIPAIPLGSFLNLSIENADGSEKLWGSQEVVRSLSRRLPDNVGSNVFLTQDDLDNSFSAEIYSVSDIFDTVQSAKDLQGPHTLGVFIKNLDSIPAKTGAYTLSVNGTNKPVFRFKRRV